MMRLFVSLVVLAGFATSEVWAGWRKDVEFARPGGFSLTLDAWVPDGAGPFPAVIVVHGGGFTAGDKRTYVKPLFNPLTKAGFTWFTINYRLAPKFAFPAATDDVEAAIRWVKQNAAAYKADPGRIAIVGESAGGHLVAYVGAKHRPGAEVAAVVSFYGPHDFEARARKHQTLSNGLKGFLQITSLDNEGYRRMREASPATYVHAKMPPYLLIHGTADPLVDYEQSVDMCSGMNEAGASCELFTVEGGGHGVENWEKSPAHQTYKTKMIDWLKSKLR
jgi:alpha-L-fucosidase 2